MTSTAQSKLLSLILRHEPAKAGLTLEPGGWVVIDDLLDGLNRLHKPMTRAELDLVVAESAKKRLTISDDGSRIRAAQGHSVPITLDLPAVVSPNQLYHGTATRFLPAIQNDGLKRMSRPHVHLSRPADTATKVGRRHGTPTILRVQSARMATDGHEFFQADNGVWLTAQVPPTYLIFEGSP
ncbi:RNA 2'-phosphotransferase [Actibacterium sp. 188UL27-1]|uniref:RNA 2'-phosphotransferase n=1 Tax=Actibacterium sp. 188UL27-1 TaxID=2786961 RepID=UPI00195E20FE|nr:RNA 2'-phosphotransferase [Actibacterium sp. 188UL27-1]MBM7066910.1 RNA 2'-phosphotransferase [Actibacterium sp. 188UL27-1]